MVLCLLMVPGVLFNLDFIVELRFSILLGIEPTTSTVPSLNKPVFFLFRSPYMRGLMSTKGTEACLISGWFDEERDDSGILISSTLSPPAWIGFELDLSLSATLSRYDGSAVLCLAD